MAGTAPPARRWLLLEQPARWLPQAFAGMALDPEIRRTVQTAADAALARILLIRRPGRTPARSDGLAWCVVDPPVPRPVVWGRWAQDTDLLQAADLLRRSGQPQDPSDAPPSGEPGRLLLVCTHGRHDVCCAVRGRPVAAALAQRWPEETWECSHIGGDRFAASVVSLPDGTTLGGLDADTAPGLVAGHLAGRPDPAYLRGVCGHAPLVQTAIIGVLERLGPMPASAVRPVRADRLSTGRWQVRLEVAGHGRVVVDGREVRMEPTRMTCSVLTAHTAVAHVVTGVTHA